MARNPWLTALLALALAAGGPGCAAQRRQQRAAAQVDLGRAYLAEGRTEAAIEALQRSLRYQRRNWVAWNHLGLALMEKGRAEEAERAFRKAVRLSGGKAEPRLNYGVFLVKQGRVSEAVEQYEAALDDLTYRKPSVVLNDLGYAYYLLGRYADAERTLAEAVRRAPNLCPARFNLGLAQQAQGKPEALDTFEDVILLCGDEAVGAWLQAGRILAERGDWIGAEEHLRKVIELAPGSELAREAQELLSGGGRP